MNTPSITPPSPGRLFASNELASSLQYALRKTSKTITISLTALEGAAIVNNTFALAIFLSLVYFRELRWAFR